jgi:hypothetical protein
MGGGCRAAYSRHFALRERVLCAWTCNNGCRALDTVLDKKCERVMCAWTCNNGCKALDTMLDNKCERGPCVRGPVTMDAGHWMLCWTTNVREGPVCA